MSVQARVTIHSGDRPSAQRVIARVATSGVNVMFLNAPFTIPAAFLRGFEYPGTRRLVALYWTPLGDEACFDDGQQSATGLSDNFVYLDLIRRPDVATWLANNHLELGNSDIEANHWLVVDAVTCEVYAAHWREARQAVIRQVIP